MTLREDMRRLLGPLGEPMIVGTVTAVDTNRLAVDVQPEIAEAPPLKAVPIRVLRSADALGCYIVPSINSLCLVGHVDGRPTLVKAQSWSSVVLRGDSVDVAIEAGGALALTIGSNTVEIDGSKIKIQAAGAKPAARRGDETLTDATTDTAFWAFWQAVWGIVSGTPIAEPGNGSPSALQAALAAAIATAGGVPAELKGKINAGSGVVEIGG